MKKESQDFLAEGIRCYDKACDVLESFEEEFKKELRDVLKARKGDWKKFCPSPAGEIVSKAGAYKGWGRWIYAEIFSQAIRGTVVSIEIGLWWSCPKASAHPSPVLYVGAWKYQGKRETGIDFAFKNPAQTFKADTRYLCAPTSQTSNLSLDFNRLLDQLESATKAELKVRK